MGPRAMWGLLDREGGYRAPLGPPGRPGSALPGQQLEGSKYSAGRPGHIPGRPGRPACPLLQAEHSSQGPALPLPSSQTNRKINKTSSHGQRGWGGAGVVVRGGRKGWTQEREGRQAGRPVAEVSVPLGRRRLTKEENGERGQSDGQEGEEK